MRDELIPAKDLGVYWIEHVLRHKGAKHLQLIGKDMSFHQRYLLDVIAFLVGIPVVFLLLTVFIVRRVLSKCKPVSAEKVNELQQTNSKKVKNKKKKV